MIGLPGWTPLAIVAALYLWQVAEYLVKREYGLAVVFFSYALGNCGFIWDYIRRLNAN